MRTIRGLSRMPGRAFTLVEMIGVLAILAIVLALVAPSVVRQFQTATAMGEDAKLDDIAQALTNAIRATGIIPNPNLDPATTNATDGYGWAYLASNYTKLAGANLLSVFPGSTTETRRRVYLSTNLAGAASEGGFANTISNWGPTFFPTNAKMYVVSSSRPDFALALAANGPGAQTNANNYADPVLNSLENWNKQFSNGVCVAPTTLVDSSWTNKGEFLHVRTVDLSPIFNEARAAQQKISDQEDKNLEEIARALLAYIQATGTIPNPTVGAAGGWVANIATYSSLGSQAIQYSFPASSIGERRFYLDAALLPYVGGTPAAGWANPPNPALPASAFLVSISKEDANILESTTTNGGTPLSAGALNFLRTWQKTPNSSGVVVANNTEIVTPAWANRGEFLHVKAFDLRTFFCRVELEDLSSPATATIDNPGGGYSGPFTITNSGLTLSLTVAAGGLSSISVVSPASKNLWAFSGKTNSLFSTNVAVVGGGGAGGVINLNFPAAPNYAAGAGVPFMMPTQVVVFYVLKGGSINLGGTSFVVQQDVKYQYSNSTWRQVY